MQNFNFNSYNYKLDLVVQRNWRVFSNVVNIILHWTPNNYRLFRAYFSANNVRYKWLAVFSKGSHV